MQNFGNSRLDVILSIKRRNRQRKFDCTCNFCRRGPLGSANNNVRLFSTDTYIKTAVFFVKEIWYFYICLAARRNACRRNYFFSKLRAEKLSFNTDDFDSTRTSCINCCREIFYSGQTTPSTSSEYAKRSVKAQFGACMQNCARIRELNITE